MKLGTACATEMLHQDQRSQLVSASTLQWTEYLPINHSVVMCGSDMKSEFLSLTIVYHFFGAASL